MGMNMWMMGYSIDNNIPNNQFLVNNNGKINVLFKTSHGKRFMILFDAGRTVEGNGKENKGYPVCRKTIELPKLVDSMATYDENRIILGAKDELQILDIGKGNISPLSTEHKGRINCVIKLSNNDIIYWEFEFTNIYLTFKERKTDSKIYFLGRKAADIIINFSSWIRYISTYGMNT